MKDLTLPEFSAWLGHVADYLGHYDADPVLDDLRKDLADSVRENFEAARTPSGATWQPLKKPDHPPLQRTGNLLLSAIESAYYGVAQDDVLSFDLSLLPPYWIYHQYGTATIPARPFLGFPDDFLDHASEKLAEDVTDKMRAL